MIVLNLQVEGIPFSVTYYGLMILCLGWLSFLLVADPYSDKHESRKEIVNSYLFLCYTYFIPAYTFITPDANKRFYIGNFSIYIIGLLITVNLIWTII